MHITSLCREDDRITPSKLEETQNNSQILAAVQLIAHRNTKSKTTWRWATAEEHNSMGLHNVNMFSKWRKLLNIASRFKLNVTFIGCLLFCFVLFSVLVLCEWFDQ